MLKRKILYFLDHYPQISETYIETELRSLQPKYRIKIISLGKPNLKTNNHLPYEYISSDDKEALARAIVNFSPDIIHGHYVVLVPALNWASHVAKVPHTVRAHSFDVLGRNEPNLKRYVDIINSDVCLGVLTFPFTRPMFERAGIRSEKLNDCYPVVDFARFHDISRNGDFIMNVGACFPKKNMEEFLILAAMVENRTFNLYALGYGVEKLHQFNGELGNPVNIIDPVQPEEMCPEYKKHEWLVYTASHQSGDVGWPMAIAEAQAAGVGVCMQSIRPDLREYVGEAGFLFDTADDAARIISQPFPDDLRQLGFEQARKSDIRGHIHRLENLWKRALGPMRESRPELASSEDD